MPGAAFEPLVTLAAKVVDEKALRINQSSDAKKSMTFWNMLNYAVWKRLIINKELVDRLKDELDASIARNGYRST